MVNWVDILVSAKTLKFISKALSLISTHGHWTTVNTGYYTQTTISMRTGKAKRHIKQETYQSYPSLLLCTNAV